MSVNSMANMAIARRADFAPEKGPPKGHRAIAKASGVAPELLTAKGGGSEAGRPADGLDTASNVLVGYIPTEIVTLYVAVLGALQDGGSVNFDEKSSGVAALARTVAPHEGWPSAYVAFFFFLIATPIVIWIVYATKVKTAGKPIPFAFGQWPMWEMIAGTLAYTAWALALPGSFQPTWYTAALGAVILLITSAVLGLVAPLFQREIKP